MKNIIFSIFLASLTTTLWAAPQLPALKGTQNIDIPERFSTFKSTEVMEWGCPVSDLVKAGSSHEAIRRISEECVAEVTRAASEKEGVTEVIKVNVVWPDVSVTEEHNGYRLSGTFFLETFVLQGGAR